MNKTRRFLSLLLTLVLTLSLCVIPAAAANTQARSDDPVVCVHGLMGWGQRDKINRIMPYWGMTTGSLTDYLSSQGYETYAASVGPISSAWDRACELYAQLVGARTDYGVKHSQDFGHDRYGIDYEQPLFDGWGTERAVNLVGHSFGGATTRLFLDILANGRPEEVAAAKAAGVEPSPFFLGGKGSWVHSLTAIAAPHNGTTFIETCGDFTMVAAELATSISKALGLSVFKGVYDFQLDQFGIRKDDGETFSTSRSTARSRSTTTSASSRTSTISPTPETRPCRTRPATASPPRRLCGDCFTRARRRWADTMTATPPAAFTSTSAGCRTTAWSTPSPPSIPPTATAPA